MSTSDDEDLNLGEDETVQSGQYEQNPLNQLIDQDTREKLHQAAQFAAKLHTQYGAGKVIMGGGVALTLAGAALTFTKD